MHGRLLDLARNGVDFSGLGPNVTLFIKGRDEIFFAVLLDLSRGIALFVRGSGLYDVVDFSPCSLSTEYTMAEHGILWILWLIRPNYTQCE
jgi:hypothetical protein